MNIGKRRVVQLLVVALLVWGGGAGVVPQAGDPGQPGPCAVTSQQVTVGDLPTYVYYPSGSSCGEGLAAPYPAILFAHGFTMFGLTNGATDNAGNGRHLASWGYVVAIPRLPDDVEDRLTAMQALLSYLETENGTPGSYLYQKVDTNRIGAAGHSFGGQTVLQLAAHDDRVKAVVALDPVYHQGGFGSGEGPVIWDPEAEGPQIEVPAAILGAPAQECNSNADYAEIYPHVGATHKASFLVAGASHCHFMDPGDSLSLCYFFCGGGAQDAEITDLIQKYMTAWFNYYLHLDTDFYTYLYGAEASADLSGGVIEERRVDTAPRRVAATALVGAVELTWELYGHPIIAGYNIYRRSAGGAYPPAPQVKVGRVSSYLDRGLTAGQVYSYVLCSRDSAGNPHQLSSEVSAVPVGIESLTHKLYLPVVLRSWP